MRGKQGREQGPLVRKILVERADGHARPFRDAGGGEAGIAAGQQNLNARSWIAATVAEDRAWIGRFLGASERLLPGTPGLPAVVATRDLTAARFPEPGSRRLVCLADGGSAIEEVLRLQPGRLLTYVVWGYTSAVAQPPAYGFGAFRFTDDGDATRVDWTYAFRLKLDRFPGNLGALGRDLFRLAFLDTNSARFMQAGMAAIERESLAAAP